MSRMQVSSAGSPCVEGRYALTAGSQQSHASIA